VYCPRCGSPNEADDRFCSACGAELPGAPAGAEKPSLRQRIGQLIGTTRRARLASAGTVAALIIALVAFAVLKPAKDEIPRDAYTIAADRICIEAKHQIVAVERQSVAGSGPRGSGGFAQALVPAVGTWRLHFQELIVPADRVEEARQLSAALLDAEIKIAKLARAEASGDGKTILATARRADAATTSVEEAASSLGLTECASAAIGFSASRRANS
jgi:hypothetical protein